MYASKIIVNHNEEISLPKCMYKLRKIIHHVSEESDVSMEILRQPNQTSLMELEKRQEKVLKKCDELFERIKLISLKFTDKTVKNNAEVQPPKDIVLIVDPENLPFYLECFMKKQAIEFSWHIHSSVPTDKQNKIKPFVSKLQTLANNKSAFKLRMIFKTVSVNAELRTSSLQMPIIGNMNILRYLAIVFPCVDYHYEDYHVEHILDLCHQLERTVGKDTSLRKINEIFAYKEKHLNEAKQTILDLALCSIMKQRYNIFKGVHPEWFSKCITNLCS